MSRKKGESLLQRMARVGLEVRILEALAQSPAGLGYGEIESRFRGPARRVLDGLVENFQVDRYEGAVFAITQLGRTRIAPPVCVAGEK